MAKKTRVALHGVSNNRGVLIDPNATDGARVGKNLYWSDGSLVEEEEIRGGSTSTTTTTTGSAVQPTLWSLILNIPLFIKALAGLTGNGEGFVVKTASDTAALRSIQAQDSRILVTNGDAQAGDPTIGMTEWPRIKASIGASEEFILPSGYQAFVWESIDVEGSLDVEGELIVLGNDLPEPYSPDFTYDGSGNLTQIDYPAGEQKLFTYNGSGDLTRLDYIRDGVTLRKDFIYSGGNLDYIDEYYV